MPGHIKLTKGAVDPDPTEFLLPSIEMKRADQAKVYDSKKSVWIPDPKVGGSVEDFFYHLSVSRSNNYANVLCCEIFSCKVSILH